MRTTGFHLFASRALRFLASTGIRLAVLQTLLLITAFAVAGSLTAVSVKLIYRDEVRTRILGQVSILSEIDRAQGAGAVVAAITQDGHRQGGLEYRLTTPDGRPLGGDLPRTDAALGWTYLDWDDAVVPGRPFQDLMVYTGRLSDGSILTIGQDLSEESKLRHALKRMLFWCGALGAAVGLALSYLLGRGALKRVEAVVVTARGVSAGRMQMRAPTRKGLIPDDIDELSAAFNQMLDEIALLVSRVRWVSTDIAHDLRTPLSHVRQKLDRIKGAADPAIVAAAEAIDHDVDALLRTFDAMLRLAEIENGPQLGCQGQVDLGELAGRIADAYRFDIEQSGRRLVVDAPAVWAQADADLVAQALANLLENAMRHTPTGAVIRLGVQQTRQGARLSVTDDGPGIPPDQREAVLRRFHRLEASRTTPGSGLGLAIIAAIAKRHRAVLTLTDAGPGLDAALLFPGG